jgi:prepilin-type N-terminal cleavage/methylation domain-containing protein
MTGPASPRDRGFTLVEAMIVMILAGVVTLGLMTFYFTSQATWLDASSQALAQRDATMIIQVIGSEVREAGSASLTDCGGRLVLYRDAAGTQAFRTFFLSPTDSLVHKGGASCLSDEGPIVSSHVEEFSMTISGSPPVLKIERLRVRSATGERVEMSSSFAMYNAP